MSKKTSTTLAHKFLQFGLVILTLGVGSYSTLAEAKEAAGVIKLVRGDVKILDAVSKKVVADPSGKRGRSTKKGAPFYEGETIQTAPSARVKLEFVEGKNSVVLGPGTSLVITRAGDGENTKGTDLELTKGTVRSTVNAKYSAKGDDVFQVKTPNAVAGVRGTIFNVEFDVKTAKTKVVTVEGLVSLMNRKSAAPGAGGGRFNNNRGEVLVGAGSKSEMSADAEAPTPPQKASQQEIDQADELESSVEESDEGESDAEASPQTASNSEEAEESESEGASGAEGNSDDSQETADADTEQTDGTKPENEESARTENDKPEQETADAGPENEQPKQEPGPVVENEEDSLPPVALAPEPSDSMNEETQFSGDRGIASVDDPDSPERMDGPAIDPGDSGSVDSGSMMMPGGEEFAFDGPGTEDIGMPFDLVNDRMKEQLSSSVEERDRTNQTSGTQSTILVPIQ